MPLTRDVKPLGLNRLFSAPKRKRTWKTKGARKRVKKAFLLAARIRRKARAAGKSISAGEALRKAYAKVKRKGVKRIAGKSAAAKYKYYIRRRARGRKGRKGPGF